MTISLFSLLLPLTNNVFANTSIDVGPTIGKKVPRISVLNPLKQQVNVKQLSSDKVLIILIFRLADWCSFCKKYLIELNNHTDKFITLGYFLAAISYDNTDVLKTFTEQKSISYPLLSDQKVQTILAYDIVNAKYGADSQHYVTLVSSLLITKVMSFINTFSKAIKSALRLSIFTYN